MPFVAVRLQWGQRIFSLSVCESFFAGDRSFCVWDSEVIKEKSLCGYHLYFTFNREEVLIQNCL
jgi:hypothetical protein